jgi:uncharacterized protein YjbI with pentapeptide repeats
VGWWLTTISLMLFAAAFAGILWEWWASVVKGYPTLAIALAVGIGVAILRSAFWFWWLMPKVHAGGLGLNDAKARADVEDNFRKASGQLIGGAAVLVGAGFAYVQFLQQQQASQNLLISNQVSKGFEQMGNESLAIRVGGIYALMIVMNIPNQYSQPVLDVLSAFVRVCTEDETKIGHPKPFADIQAALTVIGKQNFGGVADLNKAHIPGADLRSANLSKANLSEADLSQADMTGAVLNDAELRETDLNDAKLIDAKISQDRLNKACGFVPNEKLPPKMSLNRPCLNPKMNGTGTTALDAERCVYKRK